MIILDTNVFSELMKMTPALEVDSWLRKQNVTQLFFTTIGMAEVSYGISLLPAGKRRTMLERSFQKIISQGFMNRILSFDEDAAQNYGLLMSKRKALGHPMGILDGQIAAIAMTYSAMLATRNIQDFRDCDLDLINPFI